MNRLGIFGTSGMAREAGDIAWELGFAPIYVARDKFELDRWLFPGEIILEKEVNRYRDIKFIIGIGNNVIRERISIKYKNSLRFSNLIHPHTSFGKSQRNAIEEKQGIIVCAGVRFTNNIRIGDFCIFNLNATINHDVDIDNYVYVAPGVRIAGNVQIGMRSWIGTGVSINQGEVDDKLRIGADTVIGSGAVVIRNCDPNAVYVGVPAERIK